MFLLFRYITRVQNIHVKPSLLSSLINMILNMPFFFKIIYSARFCKYIYIFFAKCKLYQERERGGREKETVVDQKSMKKCWKNLYYR